MLASPRETIIKIDSGTIVRVILFLLLVGVIFYLKDLVLVLLTAIVIASAIEPATRFFMKYKIPRLPAVVLIYLIVALVILGLFYFFVPPVLHEASGFLATLPAYIDEINVPTVFEGSTIIDTESLYEALSIGEFVGGLQSSISTLSSGVLKTVSIIFGGIFSFVLIIVFSFYFAVQETGIDDFLRVVTPVKQQSYVLDLWRRSQNKIGKWIQGQFVLGLIMGILVFLGLTVIGIQYALLLAVLAAIAELIPIFGPILAAVPAVILALLDGGLGLALGVVGFYVVLQQFENHLIYPLVVTKVVGVPPLLVILALIVGAQFAGFLGIILSVPVAAAVQEFVTDVKKRKDAILKREPQGA